MLSHHYRRRMAEQTPTGTAACHRVGKRRSLRRTLALFLLLTLGLLLAADLTYRPNVAEALRYQGQIAAARILSAETLRVLEEMQLEYDDLVQIARDDAGRITSVETNTTRLNMVKSRLEQAVTAALNEQGACEVRLPLGTLLGSEYLMGRGPVVSIRFQPMGSLQTLFESQFQSAGINQTSHRIALELTLPLTTLLPMHRAETVVTTNFILADTIIVGEVPEYYTGIAL